MVRYAARLMALTGLLALASGATAWADALADLPVFTPAVTDTLSFDARDGVSTIGTFSVRGPILELCDAAKSQCATGYPGMAISLPPAGKLNFSLTSHLPGAAPAMPHCMDGSAWSDTDGWRSAGGLINLHTHGLLVKPYAKTGADPAANRYGDYVFDCVTGAAVFTPLPGGHVVGPSMNFADDLAERVGPGAPGQPFGINWFHPHVHGIAKAQVSLGMAGMILTGDPLTHLCLSVNPATETCNTAQSQQLLAKTRVRNILVKDAQLVHLGGAGGRWLNMADQDPALCQGNELASENIGQCLPVNPTGMVTPAGTAVDPPGDPDLGPRWLFTLNGQRYPDIDFDTAHPYQLLRIQNASANVTYKLSLRRSFDDTAVAAPYAFSPKFQILSLDGAGYVATGSGEKAVKQAREILLMPASRADLLIDAAALCPLPCIGGAVYQLVTDSYQAGFAPSDADTWPQVALARIAVPSAGPALTAFVSAPPQAMLLQHTMSLRPAVSPAAIEQTCRLGTGAAASYALRIGPSDKRRLYFGIFKGLNAVTNEAVEDFVLGATVLHADNTETDLTGRPIDPAHNPVRMHPMNMMDDKVDLCVGAGQAERWQLVNVTNEVHNFHIHQLKFTVARGANDGPVWRAPSPLDDQVLPEELIFHGGETELQHDTIVVPRGRSECGASLAPLPAEPGDGTRVYTLSHALFTAADGPSDPNGRFVPAQCDGSGRSVPHGAQAGASDYLDLSGMIEVTIPFTGSQLDPTDGKPARFVYHCHILEHEDKGMMASIAVLRP